jgi:hypothetical protein
VARDGQVEFGRALTARTGIVNCTGGGPGGSQNMAGGPDGGGRLTSSSGCFGGRLSGFLAQPEQGVDLVRKGGSEGTGTSMLSGRDRVVTRSLPALAAVRIRSRWA